jgi:hypothetical protein
MTEATASGPASADKPEEGKKVVPVINSAIGVANWFIGKNRVAKGDLTHLKLQKILYFAQG